MPRGVRLVEALTTPRFYLLAVATGSMWFCIVGIIAHQPIYFRNDIGLTAEQLGTVTGTLFFFGLIGKVLFGALSDRYRKDRIMLLAIINLTVGSLILRFTDGSLSQIYIYAAVYGVGVFGRLYHDSTAHRRLLSGPIVRQDSRRHDLRRHPGRLQRYSDSRENQSGVRQLSHCL